MKNKVLGILVLFIFCFIGIGNVKAEKFNVQFKCGGNRSDGQCNFAIVDGKLEGKTEGCRIITGASTSVLLKIPNSNINISGPSNCYNFDYSCDVVFDDSDKKSFHYEITKMTLSPTDATKTDVGNGIICPSKPLVDMCGEYNESNFASKCKNENANYKTFRGMCDLSYQDAMNYCEGKGNFSNPEGGGASVEEVRKKAEETKEQSKENPELEQTNCYKLMDGEVALILKNIFLLVSVIGVVILVFTMASDFIKAIASSDNDAMSKAFSSAKTRIIATIILLILPALVSFIIDLINDNTIVVTDSNGNRTEVKIGDPSDCNITD